MESYRTARPAAAPRLEHAVFEGNFLAEKTRDNVINIGMDLCSPDDPSVTIDPQTPRIVGYPLMPPLAER